MLCQKPLGISRLAGLDTGEISVQNAHDFGVIRRAKERPASKEERFGFTRFPPSLVSGRSWPDPTICAPRGRSAHPHSDFVDGDVLQVTQNKTSR